MDRFISIAGAVITGLWILLALFGPVFDPEKVIQPLVPVGGSDKYGHIHLLGTDLLGRDILSRISTGGRWAFVYGMSALVPVYAIALLAWRVRWLSPVGHVVAALPPVIWFFVLFMAGFWWLAFVAAGLALAVPGAVAQLRAIDASGVSRSAARVLIADAPARIALVVTLIETLGVLGIGPSTQHALWGWDISSYTGMLLSFPHMPLAPITAWASFLFGLFLLSAGLNGGRLPPLFPERVTTGPAPPASGP